MLYPSINELLTKIDNRYTLVVAVSKRARQLIDGDDKMIKTKEIKPVSVAVLEVDEEKIGYRPLTNAEVIMMQQEEKRVETTEE